MDSSNVRPLRPGDGRSPPLKRPRYENASETLLQASFRKGPSPSDTSWVGSPLGDHHTTPSLNELDALLSSRRKRDCGRLSHAGSIANSEASSSRRPRICAACNDSYAGRYDPIVKCATCQKPFHDSCRKPRTAHDPKSPWSCYQCINRRAGGRTAGSTRNTKSVVKGGFSASLSLSRRPALPAAVDSNQAINSSSVPPRKVNVNIFDPQAAHPPVSGPKSCGNHTQNPPATPSKPPVNEQGSLQPFPKDDSKLTQTIASLVVPVSSIPKIQSSSKPVNGSVGVSSDREGSLETLSFKSGDLKYPALSGAVIEDIDDLFPASGNESGSPFLYMSFADSDAEMASAPGQPSSNLNNTLVGSQEHGLVASSAGRIVRRVQDRPTTWEVLVGVSMLDAPLEGWTRHQILSRMSELFGRFQNISQDQKAARIAITLSAFLKDGYYQKEAVPAGDRQFQPYTLTDKGRLKYREEKQRLLASGKIRADPPIIFDPGVDEYTRRLQQRGYDIHYDPAWRKLGGTCSDAEVSAAIGRIQEDAKRPEFARKHPHSKAITQMHEHDYDRRAKQEEIRSRPSRKEIVGKPSDYTRKYREDLLGEDRELERVVKEKIQAYLDGLITKEASRVPHGSEDEFSS